MYKAGEKVKPRVVQLTPTISYGDAVSNDVFAMSEVLSSLGYENVICAIAAAEKVKCKALTPDKLTITKNDVLIYHMSIGSALSELVINAQAKRKIMVYHNITPAEFFDGVSEGIASGCRQGRNELKELSVVIDYAICDSEYNREELVALGYKDTAVLPIVFDKAEYLETKPSESILEKYRDTTTNILFVGRIAPNKKQEDVIHSFCLYNRHINPKSRLILVGAVVETESYREALDEYILSNGIKNVIFSGHVSFADILAYYRAADLFLCESEHEGFCVPLLEAMTFDIPILAYSSCAVPYTMGKSGVLFTEKEHTEIAEAIDILVTDEKFREKVISSQRKRLEDFDISKTKESFKKLILSQLEEGRA